MISQRINSREATGTGRLDLFLPASRLRGAARVHCSTRTCRLISVALVIACALPLMAGCPGMTMGQALYWSGLFPQEKVKAEYKLGDGALLILVDDPDDMVNWPQMLAQFNEALRDELLRNKAAKDVMTADTAVRLRGSTPDFDKKGAREVGQLAGADQVLWVEIRDFYAQDQIEQMSGAAKLTVTVKVINSHFEAARDDVRLWPDQPDGELVNIELSGPDVARAKTMDAISRALAAKGAEQVAKLFYDHVAPDFRSGK